MFVVCNLVTSGKSCLKQQIYRRILLALELISCIGLNVFFFYFFLTIFTHIVSAFCFVNTLLRSHVDGAADAAEDWCDDGNDADRRRQRSFSSRLTAERCIGPACVALDPAVRWNVNTKPTSPTAVIWTRRSQERCFLPISVTDSDKEECALHTWRINDI